MTPEAYHHKLPPAAPADLQARRRLAWSQRVDAPGGIGDGNPWEQAADYKGTVYLVVQAYLRALARATVEVVERRRNAPHARRRNDDDDYTPVRGAHPLTDAIEAYGPAKLLKEYAQQRCIFGQHLLWMHENDHRQVVSLSTIPVPLVTPVYYGLGGHDPGGSAHTSDMAHGGWRVTAAAGPVGFAQPVGATIPRHQVAWYKDPHPVWQWVAKSPLQAGGYQCDILEAIEESIWAYYDHGVQLDAVFMLPGHDQASVDAFIEGITQRRGGARNARKPLGVGGGMGQEKYDVKNVSPSARDIDYQNGRAAFIDWVHALFGVPKGISGFAELSAYAAVYAQQKQFRETVLDSFCADAEDAWTRQLARRYGDRYALRIKLPDLDDREQPDAVIDQGARDGTLTVNEIRRRRNLPPWADPKADELPPSLYVPYLQSKNQPQPLPGADPAGGPPTPAAPPAPAADTQTPPGPPRPDNPAGEGSLAPRLKAVSSRRRKFITPMQAVAMLDAELNAIKAKWL